MALRLWLKMLAQGLNLSRNARHLIFPRIRLAR